jgi:hypothetical protein
MDPQLPSQSCTHSPFHFPPVDALPCILPFREIHHQLKYTLILCCRILSWNICGGHRTLRRVSAFALPCSTSWNEWSTSSSVLLALTSYSYSSLPAYMIHPCSLYPHNKSPTLYCKIHCHVFCSPSASKSDPFHSSEVGAFSTLLPHLSVTVGIPNPPNKTVIGTQLRVNENQQSHSHSEHPTATAVLSIF